MRRLDGEWWATVIHEFRAHVREEATFLDAYEALVAESSDESVRFLLELIVADEHRHHDLFSSMADASVADDAGDGLPAAPRLSAETARRLLEPTERFLDAEREETKKLAALRRELKPLRTDTLWPLLVELMEVDTGKHVRILEYLRDRLTEATG
jgi:rubrerythrin